jgi:hypothetical protein
MRRRLFLAGLVAVPLIAWRTKILNALDFPNLQSAINAAAGGRLVIPRGSYTTTGLTGVSNIQIDTDGPVTISSSTSAPILDFTNCSNFALNGHLSLVGNGPAYVSWGPSGYGPGPCVDTGQHGIKLNNCDRYDISGKIEIRNMNGAGILRQASAGGWQHQGRISGVRMRDCFYGMKSEAILVSGVLQGSEYDTHSDLMIDNCVFGILEACANNTYSNCKTIFCSIGAKITGATGINHSHGIFTGWESNHNTYDLTMDGASYGYTFSGCHLISDQSGSGPGIINILNGSRANFTGGNLGATLSIDATSIASVQGAYIRIDLSTAPVVTSGGIYIGRGNWSTAGILPTGTGQWNT